MKERQIPGIIGLGTAVGKKQVTNRQIAEMIAIHRNGSETELTQKVKERFIKIIDRLLGPVGTDNRYWADNNQTTSDLAVEAAKNALEMANCSPRELKAITVGTMSPDYQGVPIAPSVQHKLEAKNTIAAKDIQAACAGFLYLLYDVYKDLTSPLGQNGPQLGIGAEILSRHLHPSHGETFGLFGDGAGAFVADLVADKNHLFSKIAFHFGADGQYQTDLYIPAGGTALPASINTVKENMHCLQMNGQVIKEQSIKRMVEATEAVLMATNLKVGDISLFIPHQANREIMLKVAKLLNIPQHLVYINIHRYGNTSAASIPLAMKNAYDEGKLVPDEVVVLASFGAGLTFGAAVIPMVGLPKKPMSEVLKAKIISSLPPRQ